MIRPSLTCILPAVISWFFSPPTLYAVPEDVLESEDQVVTSLSSIDADSKLNMFPALF